VTSGPLVVVGDTLLDVDVDGTAERLAPDGPVPVVDCHRERHRPGGAGLAAVLAAGMAPPDVVLITALGDDRNGARLRGLLGGHVEVLRMPLRGGTPCKIRVRASGMPIARLDAGNGRAAPAALTGAAERALRSASGILVADYGRGVTAHPGLRAALARLPGSTPVVWDPHPHGEPPVPGTRLATPNQQEAHGFAHALAARAADGRVPGGRPPGTPEVALRRAARDAATLTRAWGTAVAVTLGAQGALLSVGEDAPFLAPAPAPAAGAGACGPHDACGAGDCFAAAAAQVIQAGAVLTEAVTEAVRRASEFVSLGGPALVPSLTVAAEAGIVSGRPSPAGAAWDTVADIRRRGGRIVATGGCFDLLHAGHVRLLRQARQLGDGLVVCLNSDASVRALKGPGRPLVSAQDRAKVLAALACVDAVIIFDEPTPASVLERLRPDIWVKGGDYARGELAEASVVRRYGGDVILLPYTSQHSTSRIVAAARTLAGSAGARTGQP
jgi:D-beta-D-heptose 7-phosphate kinase / D-beta-D-heptose 1-phosphate adenosyltransferase